MAKRSFWKADWFSGLLITIIFMFFSGSAGVQSIERWAYDVGVTASDRSPAENIAVIAIDDDSIANLGRWPWSRDVHAQMLRLLSEAGAKIIAPTILFTEPQQDAGAEYLKAIDAFYRQSSLGTRVVEDSISLQIQIEDLTAAYAALPAKAKQTPLNVKLGDLSKSYANSSLKGQLTKDIQELGQYLKEAGEALDADKILAQSIAESGNVLLPMLFVLGAPQGNPDQPLPEFVSKNKVVNVVDNVDAVADGAFPQAALGVYYPIPLIGDQLDGVAHLNNPPDVDGGIRQEPLVVNYFDELYPSFALMIAAKSLNLAPKDIQVKLGEGISLKNLNIGTNHQLMMNTFFYSDIEGVPAFSTDSFFDVISGKIPTSKYKNKIVLIGPTAFGISTPQKTPVNESMHPILTLAHSVSSILQEDFFVTPDWANIVQILALLLIAIYLIVVLPKLTASLAALVSLLLAALLFGSEYYLMALEATWVKLMVPFQLLVIGHGLLTTKRFLWTERSKVAVETDSSETNRMLGIAFQGQGQLDMAFEKFRKCSVDESVLDSLYNLALDYERKRQFNKAGSVYRYMAQHDADFRDVKDRMERAEQMENTMVIGGGGGAGPGATMILDGAEKPMLGRYQVEKELGKGAMGMVYLGRDPKINRVVAIKTMALSQEFEEDELAEVKERFFREAESAGRLSHPNIVTIYDAGDEQDLAYIAMELLKGDDLSPFVKSDNLLPVPVTVDVMMATAGALSYAHQQNIVHRDIKPANIMYDPETKTVKVTDFGIARITDSSKTKTGVVLGTPSYMSPEQLSGKHVDGRSDLFSLGVMFYQLLTGELPFKADSLATLMFKITNDDPTDIKLLRPELPDCLVSIVSKCLAKSPDDRYQDGNAIGADIEACKPSIIFEYGN